MVLSYYLYKLPYQLLWTVSDIIRKNKEIIFYSEEYLDVIIFQQIQKYLKDLPVYTKNREIQNLLKLYHIESKRIPSFPKAVFMCRHACHKFPDKRILKFGFRHGAYHFKKLTNSKNYNAFTKFFVTSQNEVDLAQKAGIHSTVAIGYPKLDPAFNGEISSLDLMNLHQALNFNENKKTITFTATWDASGMSAIDSWIYRLNELSEQYNVLVTVHPWTSEKYKELLRNNRSIHYLNNPDTLKYLMLSDCVIGDTSSILAEACALNKSIVTIKSKTAKRSLKEIDQLIKDISFQIDPQEDLMKTIGYAVNHSSEKQNQRDKANILMFDKLDGQAGQRAVKVISDYLPELIR